MGAAVDEMASALNVEPDTMSAWEAGRHTADAADTYAYLRLLNAFREQLPPAYKPGWAALRNPPAASTTAASTPVAGPVASASAPARRRGTSWTQNEKGYLRTEFLAGATVEELAEDLQRSERAVRWALYHLRLITFPADDVPTPRARPEEPKSYTVADKRKAHPNAYKRWSAEDEQRLAERCAQGASLAELAGEFGRNEGGIASRLVKINAEGPAAEEAWDYGGENPDAAL
ncbi:hypothetical protein [Streptomyces sp. NPDC002619]|uniref:hypothetical protein n=1 Tax=Streptomyces sp. NPDC002619 TaxID=3364655 RepID=UPI003673A1A9